MAAKRIKMQPRNKRATAAGPGWRPRLPGSRSDKRAPAPRIAIDGGRRVIDLGAAPQFDLLSETLLREVSGFAFTSDPRNPCNPWSNFFLCTLVPTHQSH
jgi:hypothetical protein